MYTRCQARNKDFVHSSITLGAVQTRGSKPQNSKKPPRGGFSVSSLFLLLGGLLARRVQRAGGVDVSDLLIREAEHLTQHLVGMLAQQR